MMKSDFPLSTKKLISEIWDGMKQRKLDQLARHYYITGRAGKSKRIALDRSLVQDRSGLIIG